jgi:hypothetical protein
MLSERDIDAAHPDAFDFVFGNLPSVKRADFNRHLTRCRYCQAVLDEYSEIGGIIQQLPPHVDPPAELEDRIVTAMTAALVEQRAEPDPQPDAEDQGATRVYPIPQGLHPAEPETQVQPISQLRSAPDDDTGILSSSGGQSAPAGTAARPMVTRLPAWRRYPRRLATVVAVAAAIITAAVVVPLSLGRGPIAPAQATVVIPLHATTAAKVSGYGAATGHAAARQDSSGSWDITLTVAHLKSFGDSQWYQCWYVGRNRQQVASAGTFQVTSSGSGTFSMTSAVDPHDFPTMEITLGPPNKNGALAGTVVLSGQATL